MFKHYNIAKAICACPHPSIPTTGRPHIAEGHKNELSAAFEVLTHVPDPRSRVKKIDLAGRSDPARMKPVSLGSIGMWRIGSGCVGSGDFQISRVGSGQQFFYISRVGSGRVMRVSKSRGSGRVKSTHLKKIAGRVVSPDPTRPDPDTDPTRPDP